MKKNNIFNEVIKAIEEQKTKGIEFDNIGVAVPLIDNYGVVVWCDVDLDGKYYIISIRKNFYNPEKNWGIEELETVSQSDTYEDLKMAIDEIIESFKLTHDNICI